MAGGGNGKSKASNLTRVRKRVEADSSASSASNASNSLKRAKDGSAFTRCGECNKDVAVALINFHDCSLDAKIKMNLEALVTGEQAEVKKKPSETKKPKTSEPKAKKEKKAKNPNRPKRPPTAFFIFMEEFRKSFKEANPDCKSVAQVAKEGGEKWKSLTDEEKKPYVDKAVELKAEYGKAIDSVNDDAGKENAENDNDDAKIEEDQDGSSEKEAKEENLDDEDA